MANPYENTDPFKEGAQGSPFGPTTPGASYGKTVPTPAASAGAQGYGGPAAPFVQPQTSYTTAKPSINPQTQGFGNNPAANVSPQPFYSGASAQVNPPPHASPSTSSVPMPEGSSAQQPEPIVPTSKFWTIQFYQQFFDVDTRLVLLRMSNTLVPINPPDFLMDRDWRNSGEVQETPQELQEAGVTLSRKPDLYGPFWICTTLWMILGIVSNIMSKISFGHQTSTNGEKWAYDFTMASVACIVIYLYCFGMGSIVWGIMKYKGLPVSLIDTLCLYGYSMFIFVLVAILCMIPVSAVQWAVVMVGGAWSTLFLIINFWNVWKLTLPSVCLIGFVACVGAFHMLLTMSFKFYFMNYKY